MRKIYATGILLIMVLLILGACSATAPAPLPPPLPTPASTPTPAPAANKQFVDISPRQLWEEIDRAGRTGSVLQRQELWQHYVNKRVKWTGEFDSQTGIVGRGSGIGVFNCPRRLLSGSWYIVKVWFIPYDFGQLVTHFSKRDTVTFEGTLVYTELLPGETLREYSLPGSVYTHFKLSSFGLIDGNLVR